MVAATDPGQSYGNVAGFVFVFNLVVGVGGLTMPLAFKDTGLILGEYCTWSLCATPQWQCIHPILPIETQVQWHGFCEGLTRHMILPSQHIPTLPEECVWFALGCNTIDGPSEQAPSSLC